MLRGFRRDTRSGRRQYTFAFQTAAILEQIGVRITPNACDTTLHFPNLNFAAAAFRGNAHSVQTRKHIVRRFQIRVVNRSDVRADTLLGDCVYP